MTFWKIIGLIFGALLVLVGGGCVWLVVVNNAAGTPAMAISLAVLAAGVALIMFTWRKPDGT
jgi:hypothetical protein